MKVLEKSSLIIFLFCSFMNLYAQNTPPKYENLLPIISINHTKPTTSTLFMKSDEPFFCKMENYVKNKSKFPIIFRIGEVGYVNYLEQKLGYQFIN